MKERLLARLRELVPGKENDGTESFRKVRYLLAVSGGLDSNVMTHLFYHLDLQFDIAHCNFHLRGEDSNLDQQFVQEQLLDAIGIENPEQHRIWVKEFDTYGVQSGSKKSIEMVARELRYSWFQELMEQFGYQYVCTAHHANDNAETILLNWVRGTGIKGMAGIPELNQQNVFRPLLHFSLAEIEVYAKQHRIPFQIDHTNLEDQFMRNRIRNRIVPLLEDLNPQLFATSTRNIKLIDRQNRFYQNAMEEAAAQVVKRIGEGFLEIPFEALDQQFDPQLVLYEILSPLGFHADQVDQVFASKGGESGRKFFSEQYLLVTDRDSFQIIEKEQFEQDTKILITDTSQLTDLGFSISFLEKKELGGMDTHPRYAYFDAQYWQYPLLIRGWEAGDSFQPLGSKGRKKVSDFFTDLKLSLIEKKRVQILCRADNPKGILWIIGLRIEHRFRVREHTEKVVVLKAPSPQ